MAYCTPKKVKILAKIKIVLDNNILACEHSYTAKVTADIKIVSNMFDPSLQVDCCTPKQRQEDKDNHQAWLKNDNEHNFKIVSKSNLGWKMAVTII